MKYVSSFVFLFFVSVQLLFSVTPLEKSYYNIIRSIRYSNSDQLVQIVRDDKIIAPIKIRAIQRMIEIYTEDRERAKPKEGDYASSIRYALENSNEDDSNKRHYTVRTEACFALSNFDGTDQAGNSLDGIKNAILKETNTEVLGSCINALSRFEKSSDLASQKLVEMLDVQTSKDVIKESDIQIAIAILGAVQRQKDEKAFVPLLRLLQSGYPETVKINAQGALDSILANEKKSQ